MNRTARALLTVAVFGLGSVVASGSPASAGDLRSGYSVFSFGEYPVYTGREVSATAVYLVNSRFLHRRVVGPGVVYHPKRYWW
jgi:hypothetical protein